jgi:hypothetical protein
MKMWEVVCPVGPGYDPVVYEGQNTQSVLIINSGPSVIVAHAWDKPSQEKPLNRYSSNVYKHEYDSNYRFELRVGIQRIVTGRMILVCIEEGSDIGFSAVAWRLCKNE